MARVSAAGTQQTARREEQKLVKKLAQDAAKGAAALGLSPNQLNTVSDSFVNFAQKLGLGTDSPLTTASYGFNPITRNRIQLEWIHRGSWLGGVAVDVMADDMTRAGADVIGELKPEAVAMLEETCVSLGIWQAIGETTKWSRLYGGAICVMLVDGQDESTPFRMESVGKGQFKGLAVFDRWQLAPSINDLVIDPGPDMGLPKYYTVQESAQALRGKKIHHSRCLRMIGTQLPYQQAVIEEMWGASVLERLFDRMVAFDSATMGAAQLVYKAYIRTMKIKQLRNIVAAGGKPLQGLVAQMELIRRYQNIEGITLLDGEDEFEGMETTAFSGLSDALVQFGQQLSGALGIPLVRLFGQSPAGLSATGESDLRMYYDNINKEQNKVFKRPVTRIYRAMAQSCGIAVPKGFGLEFRPLWQLTPKEKGEIAELVSRAVTEAEASGLISQKVGLQELKQSSRTTGIFSNITADDIDGAEESLPPAGEEAAKQELEAARASSSGSEGKGAAKGKSPAGRQTRDSMALIADLKRVHDIDVVIESAKGTVRTGGDGADAWTVVMPADYGYVRKTMGADGDQIDCYVGPGGDAWVIDQLNLADGSFDEHKCMLGYPNAAAAVGDYLAGYNDGRGWDRIGSVRRMSWDTFKEWLKNPT